MAAQRQPYPWEKWLYRYISNISSGIEPLFIDPTGSGEFRLAKNPDEKDALITIPGAGRTFAQMAGLDNRANRLTILAATDSQLLSHTHKHRELVQVDRAGGAKHVVTGAGKDQ